MGTMYGAGDGGVGVDTAQMGGDNDDGKPGWYTHTRCTFGIGSLVVPVPCAAGYSFVGARRKDGPRYWDGLVSWIGNCVVCTISADCCDAFGYQNCAGVGRGT